MHDVSLSFETLCTLQLTNRQQFSGMVCTLIDHSRNNVNTFKAQVGPQASGQWFHCKVLNIFERCFWNCISWLKQDKVLVKARLNRSARTQRTH